jgi:hypothetical protein
MIPMADNFNHADADVIFHMVSKSVHLLADEKSTYFSKAKYMNDFSTIYQPEELKTDLD